MVGLGYSIVEDGVKLFGVTNTGRVYQINDRTGEIETIGGGEEEYVQITVAEWNLGTVYAATNRDFGGNSFAVIANLSNHETMPDGVYTMYIDPLTGVGAYGFETLPVNGIAWDNDNSVMIGELKNAANLDEEIYAAGYLYDVDQYPPNKWQKICSQRSATKIQMAWSEPDNTLYLAYWLADEADDSDRLVFSAINPHSGDQIIYLEDANIGEPQSLQYVSNNIFYVSTSLGVYRITIDKTTRTGYAENLDNQTDISSMVKIDGVDYFTKNNSPNLFDFSMSSLGAITLAGHTVTGVASFTYDNQVGVSFILLDTNLGRVLASLDPTTRVANLCGDGFEAFSSACMALITETRDAPDLDQWFWDAENGNILAPFSSSPDAAKLEAEVFVVDFSGFGNEAVPDWGWKRVKINGVTTEDDKWLVELDHKSDNYVIRLRYRKADSNWAYARRD